MAGAGSRRRVGRGVLRRASVRHALRHPWQTGLSVLAVALGVAVVLSIHLATGSARRAFSLSMEAVTGRATHRITATGGVPDSLYRVLRLELGVREAAPVVEADVALPGRSGWALRLLGVDPFAEAPFRPYLAGAGGSAVVPTLLAEPATALMSAATARELGVGVGDRLVVQAGGRPRTVRLAGLLRAEDETSRRALADLLVTDVATAQELLGRSGRLSRIDLSVPAHAGGDSLVRRIRAALPPGATLVRAGARTEAASRMIRAFELNLTALSLLALIFGGFLIYNSTLFSVVRRRRLLGVLRALGVTRREVFGLVLAEAAVTGLVGAVAGVALGIGLGRVLVDLVTRTINDLYFVVSVRELAVTPGVVLGGVGLGVAATLLSAVAPAAEAATADPRTALRRSTLEERFRRAVPRTTAAGVVVGLGGAGLLLASGRSLTASFAGIFLLLLGLALLTPVAVLALMAALRPLLRRRVGVVGGMAARSVATTLSRTAPAVAALMIAISVSVGLGLMIDSFRQTVVTWLDTTLQADVYVSAPGLRTSRTEAVLDSAVVKRLSAAPGVGAVTTRRALTVPSPRGPTRLVALGLGSQGVAGFTFKEAEPDAAWRGLRDGAVIVSEPFAYRHGVGVGGTVTLLTDKGERAFPVAGVFYDYGSDQGVVVMERGTYTRFWSDRGISGLGITAAPGVDTERLVRALRVAAGPEAHLSIQSNRALREGSLEIFDRTFAVTAVLRLLAVVVAFIGVFGALMALQLERGRELGLLRATGMTPGQVGRLVTIQTGLMGLAAGLLAVPVGGLLAVIMVYVINRRSFGWTMELHVEPVLLVQAVVLGLAAALLAGVYPAVRMARTVPAHGLREE